MKTELPLSPEFVAQAGTYLNLLQPDKFDKQADTAKIRVYSYFEAVNLIGDIIKVSMLALGNTDDYDNARIMEPGLHISGVLNMALDLLPYEEAELLDEIRAAALQPATPKKVKPAICDIDMLFLSISNVARKATDEEYDDYLYHCSMQN